MRIRACALVLLLTATSASLHAGRAEAQQAQADPFTDMARARFQEGVKLFDQGKYEEARVAFLQAWALRKHQAVLLNLAQSELRSNHFVEAARHFSEFLREYPQADPAELKIARTSLESARNHTARLQVNSNVAGADVFVDGELIGRTPLPEAIDVAPGIRKVEVRLSGYRPASTEQSATMGKVTPLTLTLQSESEPAAPVIAPPVDSAAQPPPATDATADQGVTLTTQGRPSFFQWWKKDKLAWVSTGVAGAGLLMGGFFTIQYAVADSNVQSVADDIRAQAATDSSLADLGGQDRRANPCATPVANVAGGTDYRPACSLLQDNMDTRDTNKTLSYIGWGVAGAGAVGTAVLYFVRAKPQSQEASTPTVARTAVAPVVGPAMTGLAVGGVF